jgi:hypothetical protein
MRRGIHSPRALAAGRAAGLAGRRKHGLLSSASQRRPPAGAGTRITGRRFTDRFRKALPTSSTGGEAPCKTSSGGLPRS